MNRPTQQPLEITQPTAIAMAVVLLVGLMGMRDSDRDYEFPTKPPVIHRIADTVVPLPNSSLVVVPTEGWTHLSIENMDVGEPTFLHSESHMVATLMTIQPGESIESIAHDIQYEHVRVRWLQPEDLGGTPLFQGIVSDGQNSVRIQLLTTAKSVHDDDSVAAFCNSIGTVKALAQKKLAETP